MLASSWITPATWSHLHVFFSRISSNPLFVDGFKILFARWRELLSNRCQAGREMMNPRTNCLSLWPLHHIQRIAIITISLWHYRHLIAWKGQSLEILDALLSILVCLEQQFFALNLLLFQLYLFLFQLFTLLIVTSSEFCIFKSQIFKLK